MIPSFQYSLLAQAFAYPTPGLAGRLKESLQTLPSGLERTSLEAFLQRIAPLSLGEWEELYTRTWDLEPLTPPYIGFQIWGEDYRRGVFLARLQAAYRETGVEAAGELPDHLVPVLQYLGAVAEPADELDQVFGQAIEKMTAALQKREPENPYLGLLEAILAARG